jgi:hypothetical protein
VVVELYELFWFAEVNCLLGRIPNATSPHTDCLETVYTYMCVPLTVGNNKIFACRLSCTDGSEFLFLAATEREMEDWVNKISFHAKLPPSLQLLSYDDSHKVRKSSPLCKVCGDLNMKLVRIVRQTVMCET